MIRWPWKKRNPDTLGWLHDFGWAVEVAIRCPICKTVEQKLGCLCSTLEIEIEPHHPVASMLRQLIESSSKPEGAA